MSRRPWKSHRARARAEVSPSAERQAQGPIERAGAAIADLDGRPAQPFYALDTLEVMRRRGTITAEMMQAAENFRVLFYAAQLQTLRAADLQRLADGVHNLPLSLRQAEARKKVWAALKILGGSSAPAGSCLWHVVGCEWTLRQWAMQQGWNNRPLRLETASGILIAALGALQAHFGL